MRGLLRGLTIGCGGLLALIIVIGVVVVAVGGGAEEEEEPRRADREATTSPTPPSNQAKIGNLLLTVNSVTDPVTGEVYPRAEAGTRYVAVDITAKNEGEETYSLNSLNFRLKDSDGYTNETSVVVDGPEPVILHHDMVAGQEVRGYLVFKVGEGRRPVELQYQSFTGTPGVIGLAGIGPSGP